MPFEKDWRSRRVVHRTPGGKMTRVKISSMPADEQQKYNPNRFKKLSGMAMTDKEAGELRAADLDGVRTFSFYIGLYDVDDIDDISEDELTLATNSSSKVIELFDDDISVVSLKNVPIDAIVSAVEPKETKDGYDYSDLTIIPLDDMDEDHKFEKIKFGAYDMFQLDLYKYMDSIEVSVDDNGLSPDENGEVTQEGFCKYYYKGRIL